MRSSLAAIADVGKGGEEIGRPVLRFRRGVRVCDARFPAAIAWFLKLRRDEGRELVNKDGSKRRKQTM
jgi:hypothetical protein